MKLFYYLERVERIHRLIQQERTGTPTEFAAHLGLSVSRLARIIEDFRSAGAPIAYDRRRQTYYYSENFDIRVSLSFGQ